MKDFYGILGIEPGATTEEIKRAYRLKMKQTHPDANVGMDEETLEDLENQAIKVNEAFEVLNNPKTRAEYDSFLTHEIKSKTFHFEKQGLIYDMIPNGELYTKNDTFQAYCVYIRDNYGMKNQEYQVFMSEIPVGNISESEEAIRSTLTEEYLTETCEKYSGYLGKIVLNSEEVNLTRDANIAKEIGAERTKFEALNIDGQIDGDTIQIYELTNKREHNSINNSYRYIYRDKNGETLIDEIIRGDIDLNEIEKNGLYSKMAIDTILHPNHVLEQCIYQNGYVGLLTQNGYEHMYDPGLLSLYGAGNIILRNGNNEYTRIIELSNKSPRLTFIDPEIKRYAILCHENNGTLSLYEMYGKLDLNEISQAQECWHLFSSKNLQNIMRMHFGNIGTLKQGERKKHYQGIREMMQISTYELETEKNSMITKRMSQDSNTITDIKGSLRQIGTSIIAGRKNNLYDLNLLGMHYIVMGNIEDTMVVIPKLQEELEQIKAQSGYFGTITAGGIDIDKKFAKEAGLVKPNLQEIQYDLYYDWQSI